VGNERKGFSEGLGTPLGSQRTQMKDIKFNCRTQCLGKFGGKKTGGVKEQWGHASGGGGGDETGSRTGSGLTGPCIRSPLSHVLIPLPPAPRAGL
jgi:hypothetical protein